MKVIWYNGLFKVKNFAWWTWCSCRVFANFCKPHQTEQTSKGKLTEVPPQWLERVTRWGRIHLFISKWFLQKMATELCGIHIYSTTVFNWNSFISLMKLAFYYENAWYDVDLNYKFSNLRKNSQASVDWSEIRILHYNFHNSIGTHPISPI